nr:ribonuclease H-like domain-containing protein [Tanacetum cinerariifolium]
SGFVKKFSGNNVDVSQNASTSSSTMSASFTNEHMMKLLSLINEKHAANVFDSMAGLNDLYQLTKSNLLAKDPLPDVKEAFAVVSREETHMGLTP